ncbi:MAG: nuclear transport factor 2 family protein [Thermoplasmata archaeon]|nr:nuclear transport factor 2 family protein [Thermoplasmata archaeon]
MASADKLAVAETIYRYATGVDRRDWAMYRSLFTDTVNIDFSSFDPDLPSRVLNADDWVAGIVPLFTGLAATQHSMTNPLATVEGDAATIGMSMQAHHVYDPEDPASWFTVGGYYDDTLERIDGQWLLTGVRLTVTWRAGDPAIMNLARAAGHRLLGG